MAVTKFSGRWETSCVLMDLLYSDKHVGILSKKQMSEIADEEAIAHTYLATVLIWCTTWDDVYAVIPEPLHQHIPRPPDGGVTISPKRISALRAVYGADLMVQRMMLNLLLT